MAQDGNPVMIRAYHDNCKGATAFFRNRPFLEELVRLLLSRGAREYRVLVHASSIGAEPYSLALWWLHRADTGGARLAIHATDINAAFLDKARQGTYPLEILEGMSAEERSWLRVEADGVHVPRQAREMVTFLPAMSFVDGRPGEDYDAVLVMNALTYVTPQQQHVAIRNLAGHTRHVLALTAFHPDTIRRDLEETGFLPHPEGMEAIHRAWGDRLSTGPIDPATVDYSWKLPPFDPGAPDCEYRYCALFVRSQQAGGTNRMNTELQDAVEKLVLFAIERHQAGDLAGAQALYGKAVELSPSHPVALHNLGLILLQRGEVASAALLLGEAVRLRPAEAAFNYNYALALQQQGDLPQALRHYDQALQARPAYREAWENRGVILQDLERNDEAIEAYRQALGIAPDSPVANRNLGNALRVAGRLDDAIAHYRRVMARKPMDADIAFAYGATLITMGDFAAGWPYYEWRFWSPEFLERNPPYRVPLPRWDGGDLSAKTLLIYGEQGIGDEIMFASCLKDLSGIAGKVKLLCQPRLVPLFARSFESIEVSPLTGEHPPHDRPDAWMADCCVALGSLPGRFRLSEPAFPADSYLMADPRATESWRQRLAKSAHGIRIGISWRGGAEPRARHARSIALERFSPLFRRDDVTLINVQYGSHEDEIEAFNQSSAKPIVTLSDIDPLRDMDGFAALLSALDLVITVDNSTAHLAGALGVPTWLLLPAHADWRWLKGRERTPWYPSVRIFWQDEHLDAAWQGVIDRVAVALDDFRKSLPVAGKPAGRDGRPECEGPVPAKPRGSAVALLLNDTSYWYHWGCTTTSLALHEGLRDAGFLVDSIPITTFHKLTPLPRSPADFDDRRFAEDFLAANPELADKIRRCDVVVINGEGTLHGLSQTPLALLYSAYVARRWLDKNTRIINHSCYPDAGDDIESRIYRKVYGVLDNIVVREGESVNELARLGIEATAGFDCLPLYLRRHAPSAALPEGSRRVILAGSAALTASFVDSMVQIAGAVADLGHELQVLVGANAYLAADDVQFVNALQPHLAGRYALVDAHSESAWLRTIGEADLLVSGRFHHTIAAAFQGVPVAVAASNTRKMGGLLKHLGLSPDAVWLNTDEPAQAIDRVRQLLRNPGPGMADGATLERLRRLAALNFAGLPPPGAGRT